MSGRHRAEETPEVEPRRRLRTDWRELLRIPDDAGVNQRWLR